MNFPNIVSRLLDPFIVFVAIIVAGAMVSGLAGKELIRFVTVSLLTIILPPLILLAAAIKTRIVSNWDITDRKQRILPFGVLVFIFIVDYFIIARYGNPFLARFYIMFLLWFSGFFAITLFFKISGHTGVVALAAGLFIRWFGWGIWPVLILVPLIAWARVAGKKHTLLQVVAGALYSLAIVVLFS